MPIYIGNTKCNLSGVDKAYFGNVLVWQKPDENSNDSAVDVPRRYTYTKADIPIQDREITYEEIALPGDGTANKPTCK